MRVLQLDAGLTARTPRPPRRHYIGGLISVLNDPKRLLGLVGQNFDT
jgi:hypothetical protein